MSWRSETETHATNLKGLISLRGGGPIIATLDGFTWIEEARQQSMGGRRWETGTSRHLFFGRLADVLLPLTGRDLQISFECEGREMTCFGQMQSENAERAVFQVYGQVEIRNPFA